MKLYYFSIILIAFSFEGQSQNTSAYTKYINLAEISIIDSLFDNALLNYKKAFTDDNKPFAKDYYNAALCAVKLNRYSIAEDYLWKLADQGFTIDSLKSKPGFQKYIKSGSFKLLKSKIVLNKTVFPVKNYHLKTSLDTLLKDDQYFRVRNSGNYMKHEYRNIIKELDSINSYKLIALITKYGFPNESAIGLYDNHLHSSNINAIIQHQQFGSPTRTVNFSTIILDAIKKGEITSNNGLTLYTLSAGGDSLYGSGCFFYVEQPDGKYKYAYYPKFLKGLEEKYNKNRALINLESLDDYRKKVIYRLKHNEFYSDINIGVSVTKIDKSIAPYLKDLKYID